MSDRVAVVGSRWGYDEAHLSFFMHDLYGKHPDTIVVSGGAEGADLQAEQTWRMLGGETWSFRPVKLERGAGWGVERLIWERNDDICFPHSTIRREPNWKTRQSAIWYRSWWIASENCDRLVAFYRPGRSPGTEFTEDIARGHGKDVYAYVAPGLPPIPRWRRGRDEQANL